MAEISHLKNRHDVIFSAANGPNWIKFRRLVQNDMSTVEIWSKSTPDVQFEYGERLGEFNGMSSQSHVSHWRVLPLDSRATCLIAECSHLANSMSWSCHFAWCKNSIRYIENRFSPYFILFIYLKIQFGLWRAAVFVSSSIDLLFRLQIYQCVELNSIMFSSA